MNIKDYYGIDDPAYPEAEVYHFYKNNTSWKLLVLKVRLYELFAVLPLLLRRIIMFIYRIIFWRKLIYPIELIDMVNKWEK